jgi:hypothetical protein
MRIISEAAKTMKSINTEGTPLLKIKYTPKPRLIKKVYSKKSRKFFHYYNHISDIYKKSM